MEKLFQAWKLALLAIVAPALIFLVHLTVVLCLTKHGFSDILTRDFSIEQLGQFGDSMAPLSAIFAFTAAVFAGLAYRKQALALEEERKVVQNQRVHDERLRFDALFARALDLYDQALVKLDTAAKAKGLDAGQQLLINLREMQKRGDVPQGVAEAFSFWERTLTSGALRPVQRFAKSVFAIIVWLDHAASATNAAQIELSPWMQLFRDRMSGPERDVLRILVDQWALGEVRTASRKLGILDGFEFGEDD